MLGLPGISLALGVAAVGKTRARQTPVWIALVRPSAATSLILFYQKEHKCARSATDFYLRVGAGTGRESTGIQSSPTLHSLWPPLTMALTPKAVVVGVGTGGSDFQYSPISPLPSSPQTPIGHYLKLPSSPYQALCSASNHILTAYLSSRYLRSAHYVPGTMLGTGRRGWIKLDPCPKELTA